MDCLTSFQFDGDCNRSRLIDLARTPPVLNIVAFWGPPVGYCLHVGRNTVAAPPFATTPASITHNARTVPIFDNLKAAGAAGLQLSQFGSPQNIGGDAKKRLGIVVKYVRKQLQFGRGYPAAPR
jgi:hypothetical protein